MSYPERWSEHDLELTPAERRALTAGRRGPEVPAAAERAVWEALATTLAASSAPAATATGAAELTLASLVKPLALGVLLGAAVAGGGVAYERAQHPRPAPSAQAVSGGVRTPPSPVPPSPASPVATASEALPDAGRGAALERYPASPRLAPAPSARDAVIQYGSGQTSFPTGSAGSMTAESRRLVAARALLRAGRSSEALGALAAIRADFPAGALAQEREALTIEALLASGDRNAAHARAAAFLAQYPESPHAETVRKVLR